MEVLAGEDQFVTELKESNCVFQMDYSNVYWNSRLQGEHERLIEKYFGIGDVVFDVMAGIGPFAVPAAKNKGCFVFANDLNPASFEYLKKNVEKNKVSHRVVPFNQDGMDFIRNAASIFKDPDTWNLLDSYRKRSRKDRNLHKKLKAPSTINHFVMNLPASAIDFLGAFNGIFATHEDLAALSRTLVHCYCFSAAHDMEADVIHRASKSLGFSLSSQDIVEVYRVRDVSPKKEMLCLSFRLPRQVATR